MTIHIISVSVFFSALILTIIFAICKKENCCVVFGLTAVGALVVSYASGFMTYEEHNYRANHQPTFEDINNGYAVQVTYYTYADNDSIPIDTVYSAVWVGTNQSYEHHTNNIEETYYYKKENK